MRYIGSTLDPYLFGEFAGQPGGGNRWAAGRGPRDPQLIEGERTGIFVVAGQSLSGNSVNATFIPTHGSKVDNLNIYDGLLCQAIDPLLGCQLTGGNIFLRVADLLIADGVFDRVILIPIGIGATSIANWATDPALYMRLVVAGRRAAAFGWPLTAYLWMQGETDTLLGTNQTSYAASLANLMAIPAAAGFTAPWLIGQSTMVNGVVSSAVRAAQAAAVNNINVFAGADTDTITGIANRYDLTHPTAAGAALMAPLWKSSIAAAPLAA